MRGGVLQTRGQCALCATAPADQRSAPARPRPPPSTEGHLGRAAGRPARQDAERAGPVPSVVNEEDLIVGIHGAVMKLAGLNKGSAELAEEMLRQCELWR